MAEKATGTLPDLSSFRQKYPQYNDISDADLMPKLESLRVKSYADMDPAAFWSKVGIQRPDELKLRQSNTGGTSTSSDGVLGAFLPGGFMSRLSDQVVQGMTFGLSDELGSSLLAGTDQIGNVINGRPLDFGKSYDRHLQDQREGLASFQREHPVAATAGQLAGGLILGAPEVGAARSLAGNMARLGGVGAAYGAASGFGAGQNGLPNRLQGAAQGALLGGALGAAAPAVGAGASRLFNLARNVAGMQNPGLKAQDIILGKMAQDNVTPASALRTFAQAGAKPMTLADQGPNLGRLARTVQTVPGRGSAAVEQALTERQTGQPFRVAGDVRGAVSNADYLGTFEALRDTRAQQAAPLYERAFQAGPILDRRVQGFLADPIVQQGIRRGMEIQRLEALADNRPFDPRDWAVIGFDEHGAPILGGTPNMRLLDAGKRGLDDIIESARDPVTGRIQWTERLRAVDRVRRAYIDHLDTLNPDYAAARQAWAGPSQSMDAMQMGRGFARGDSEIQARTFANLSQTEREFFRMGVARELEGQIMKAPDGADVVRRIFGSPDKRARLRMLFDNPNDFLRFETAMRQEAAMTRTARTALGGSPTGRIAAEQDEGAQLGQMAMDLARGGWMGAAMHAASRGLSRARGLNEATAAEIPPLLLAEDPVQRLQALATLAARRARQNRVGGLLANTSARLLAPTAGLLGREAALSQ